MFLLFEEEELLVEIDLLEFLGFVPSFGYVSGSSLGCLSFQEEGLKLEEGYLYELLQLSCYSTLVA